MRSAIIIAIIIGILCQIVSSNISLSMSLGLFALISGILDEETKKVCKRMDNPDECRLFAMIGLGFACGIVAALFLPIPEAEMSGVIIAMAGIALAVSMGKTFIEDALKVIREIKQA